MSKVRANSIEMLDGRGRVAFTFDSVEQLKDSSQVKVGQKVRTLGYYAPGDGGGCDYEIVAAGTGTDDGGSFIDLSGSGVQAKGLFSSEVDVRVFGAVGDGVTDNFPHLQSCLSFCASLIETGSEINVTMYHPEGSFLSSQEVFTQIKSPIGVGTGQFYNTINIRGAGMNMTSLIPGKNNTGSFYKVEFTQVRHSIRFTDFSVLGIINPVTEPTLYNGPVLFVTSTVTQAGTGATAEATVVGGEITDISVTSGGEEYVSIPEVIITGDGSGATAEAQISNGQVVGVNITNPGSGYTEAAVSFKGGGSSGYGYHNRHQAIIENVRIGYDEAVSSTNLGAFEYGFRVHHLTRPLFKNIWIVGNNTDYLPNTSMVNGIYCRSCYGPLYKKVLIDGFMETGILQEGVKTYKASAEGGIVQDCIFVGMLDGVEFRHNFHPDHGEYRRGEPGVTVSSSHFNLLRYGIVLDNYSSVNILDNYIYLTREDRNYGNVPNPATVRIVNSDLVLIKNNNIQSAGYYISSSNASVFVLIEDADPSRVYGNFGIVVKDNYMRTPGLLVRSNETRGLGNYLENNVIVEDIESPASSTGIFLSDPHYLVREINNMILSKNRESYFSKTFAEPDNSGQGAFFKDITVENKTSTTTHTLYETLMRSRNSTGSLLTTYKERVQARNNTAGSEITSYVRDLLFDGSTSKVDELRTDPLSGESGYAVLFNINGSKSVKKIKCGAAGSGPGGLGRALYIDD